MLNNPAIKHDQRRPAIAHNTCCDGMIYLQPSTMIYHYLSSICLQFVKIESRASPCQGGRQRHRPARPLRPKPRTLRRGHHRQRPMAAQHQHPRGHQQPHQGHQAHGLWLPRRRLFLPQDQGRVPRKSVMNLFLRLTLRASLLAVADGNRVRPLRKSVRINTDLGGICHGADKKADCAHHHKPRPKAAQQTERDQRAERASI